MTDRIEDRLKAAGIDLPTPAAALANYVPANRSGAFLYTSGQLPFQDGKLLAVGRAGDKVTTDDAIAAARQCAINILAVAKAELADLERIARLVKLTVFVASADGFTDQPKVANGASDFFVELLGAERGRHARSAVGVSMLPLDAPVEIEAIFEVRD